MLVTSAKNEAAFIDLTIQSVVNQTVRPLRWIIVDDGSTDSTGGIVARHAAKHEWIKLLPMPKRQSRDFASKADCVNAAYDHAKDVCYDVIASLDADITFEEDYFMFLLQKFQEDPGLGIAGTPFSENGQTYNYRFSSTDHVSGACQVFRRECFETIGGYVAVRGGGIDTIAVLTARMKGWRTQTFPEKACYHHRAMGSAQGRRKILADFLVGQKDYRLGFHPLWEAFRSVYQMTRKPYVLGGGALLAGYLWAMLRRSQRSAGRELVEFQQKDQMRRLRKCFGLADRSVVGST